MKTNKAIEASKQKVVAWGDFLLNTFRKLGIADNEVIRNCHVGRSTFYRMKRGELINVDAYPEQPFQQTLFVNDDFGPPAHHLQDGRLLGN